MWQPFTFETASSIEEFPKRVLEGRYDLWWGNPLTYVQASKKVGYVAIDLDYDIHRQVATRLKIPF